MPKIDTYPSVNPSNTDYVVGVDVSNTSDSANGSTATFTMDSIFSEIVGTRIGELSAEIKTAYESEANTNAFTDSLLSKLNGIEASADVTDSDNVETAINGIVFDDIGTPAGTDQVLIKDTSDNGSLKLVDFSEIGGGGSGLTQEEVEDVVGGMFTDNTETRITLTYQDADGTIDAVVDANLANYDNTTSGFITDYTVTEGDVTAHEAALSITESQITDLKDYVVSDPTGITGADQITNMVSMTQAEYDNLGSYSNTTFYVITDA